MAKYVDGFVIAVPKSKIEDYKNFARVARKVCTQLGAVDQQELVADDVPSGKATTFSPAVV